METRKEVSKEAVRAALQALGEGGKEISYRLVYEALGCMTRRITPLSAPAYPT